MSQSYFLVRNRHGNTWYGRVIIPLPLRHLFNNRREIRKSLHSQDKKTAKRKAMRFWLNCQLGFERLQHQVRYRQPFQDTATFIAWLSQEEGRASDMAYIKTVDALGRVHEIDLESPEAEIELAKLLHENAVKLLEQYKDQPEMLEILLKNQVMREAQAAHETAKSNAEQVESPTTFHEAVDLYYNKLETHGRKGKQLAPRTLINYKDRLAFWQEYFAHREVHSLTLKELGAIQIWLTYLPANYKKKKLTTEEAIRLAKEKNGQYPAISDKTRSEYLGQLKGLLEYAFNNGFITTDISSHIELPNTKNNKSIERLPFTDEDLKKIFPGANYGCDFGIQKSALSKDSKFWFPLLAAFTGARLEEIGQLKTSDIKTCPETGIVYAMIDNQGLAADGERKRTKNLNSVRPIPIHSQLIEIGFLDYLAERKADLEDSSLFVLKRDKHGRLTKSVSSWFSRMDKRKDGGHILGYIERRGVVSKGTNEAGDRWSKSFHSFRHTAIDHLRGKQLANSEYIREPDVGLVMGHDKEKLETANYGTDRSQLELRKAVVEALSYPEVSFKDISWRKFKQHLRSSVGDSEHNRTESKRFFPF